MAPMRTFIEDLSKNNSCRTFIIAEAGVHHGGSLEIAKKLIKAAARAGADAIKFQTYKAETLVTSWAPKYWKLVGDDESEFQKDYFGKRDSFGPDHYMALADYARKEGIVFCSTPFDAEAVLWLDAVGVPFWKVASGDIDNFPLLEAIARTGKPVILSTGASYFKEIQASINFMQTRGAKDLALLHCTLAYPTPDAEANLPRIQELKNRFPGVLIGYSDHTVPDDNAMVPVLAVALGAQIVEKHFTLDRSLAEDDHYHSVDPGLLVQLIRQIKTAEDAVSLNKEITEAEWPARKNARRSLVASKDLVPGTVLTKESVAPKRPGGGISPARYEDVIGKKTTTTLRKDQQIRWGNLE